MFCFAWYRKSNSNKARAFRFPRGQFPRCSCAAPIPPRAPESPGWRLRVPHPHAPHQPPLERAEMPDLGVKKCCEWERSEQRKKGKARGQRGRPGCELSGASLPPSPPSRCQVLRGGVGARGGDGWRLSSPGSRNANSARNGEATGGGGEALRLPQPPRCRRDFASRQRGLRARPPATLLPPGTSSAKTSGSGHKSLHDSVRPLGEGPRAAGK